MPLVQLYFSHGIEIYYVNSFGQCFKKVLWNYYFHFLCLVLGASVLLLLSAVQERLFFTALNGFCVIKQESPYCHGTIHSPFSTVCGFFNFFDPLWIVRQIIFCSVLRKEIRWSAPSLPHTSLSWIQQQTITKRWCWLVVSSTGRGRGIGLPAINL